jgi:hypothetical protein
MTPRSTDSYSSSYSSLASLASLASLTCPAGTSSGGASTRRGTGTTPRRADSDASR